MNMKKTLVLFFLLLLLPFFLFCSVNARIHFSDELSYTAYNRIWVSPEEHYYSVESLSNNPNICNDIDYLFTKNIGLGFGFGFGYQSSIFDFNRFVTIPKSINGTVNAGIVLKFKQVRLSVLALLRSSLHFSRNNCVSQLGGMVDLSYSFNNGLTLISSYKYLYNYNMITSAVSFGLGYTFGGKK